MVGETLPQKSELLPNETTVLEALACADAAWTQRKLAHQTGYSIGLINTILKKLSKTGYIKIASIDRRRLQYLLTPQGLATASRIACSHVLRTFRDYQQIYIQISDFFEGLSAQGRQDLFVYCDDPELKNLLHVVVRDGRMSSKIILRDAVSQFAADVHLKGATRKANGVVLDMALVQRADGGRP